MESGTRGKDRPPLVDQVLENPLRARLVAELKGLRMSPLELAEALGEPLPSVAYHCRVVGEAGGPGLSGGT
jgi:DNA-binding transcriptional ArsR family regulator